MRALLISLLLLSACATAGAPAGDILAEMCALEVERGAAIRSGDPAALERLYAGDFVGISGASVQVTREQLLAAFARARSAGPQMFEGSTSEVLSARREGNVVIVMGRLHFAGADSMYTHVFRWTGDHWEMIAGATSPIAAL